MTQKVVVVGQGYVGLPLAMRAVKAGYDVVGLEVDESRVALLAAGRSYVEDVPESELSAAVESGKYRATADAEHAADFDFSIITVPTPLREAVPDLSYVEAAAATVGAHLRHGATVVLESTTFPGTTTELLAPILESASGLKAGRDFWLGYSPERIDPGNPVWRLENTPKVVSGIDDASLKVVQAFYESLVEQTVSVSSTGVAELTKLLENTFRHVNVALVNELAVFAHELGIDLWEAIDAASTKPFGYLRFTPGPGVGGHCLPVDPSYLSWQVRRSLGRNFRFVELANDVNDHMPEYVVQRLTLALNRARKPIAGSRILLLGLAYKRNTGDARESPAVRVAELLHHLEAQVRAVDPYVEPHLLNVPLALVPLSDEEVAHADAIVVLTDHEVFDLDILRSAKGVVLDTRAVVGGGVERL